MRNEEEKTYTKEELDKYLPIFIKEPFKRDEFYDKNENDEFFNRQKQYEKNELNNFFSKNINLIEDQIKSSINSLKKNNSNKGDDLYIKNVVSDIIKLENGQNIYTEKIKKLKLEDTNNNNFANYENVNYITIIVCGKIGVGKQTLINRIINLRYFNNNNSNQDIKEYYNNAVPFFKFVQININNQNSINVFETKKKIMNYINQKSKDKNINNKVSCIWYCFNNGTLLKEELELIKSLKNYYKNDIPIMIIHTMSINTEQINAINNLNIDSHEVIKILAMDYNNQINGVYLNSFGIDFLLNATLINWQKYSILNNASIKSKLYKLTSEHNDICECIYKLIAQQFINEYTSVKNNNDFADYIINIFRINIKYFLKTIMSEECFNRIYNDVNLFEPIWNYLDSIKQYSYPLIEPAIQSYALNFNDKQKNGNEKMNRVNKRNLDQIKNQANIYLNKNYKYIFQKHFIYHVLMRKHEFFTKYFKNELDNLSEQILTMLYDDCFQHKQLMNNIKNFFGLNFNNNINNNMNNNINNNMNYQINNNNYGKANNINEDNQSVSSNTIINDNKKNKINIANNFTMMINNNNLNSSNLHNNMNNNFNNNFNNNMINNFNNDMNNNFNNNMNNNFNNDMNNNFNNDMNNNFNNNMNNNFNNDINNMNNLNNMNYNMNNGFNNMNNCMNINNNNMNNINFNIVNNFNVEQTLNLPTKSEVYNQMYQQSGQS